MPDGCKGTLVVGVTGCIMTVVNEGKDFYFFYFDKARR
jgi:hypothetical protein